ncbi:MAG: 50S ribosomal protein L23 [Anaerolineae bacterium]
MNIYEVIVRPLETEKAYLQRELGQYVFVVNRKANKSQISHAVEEIYDVNVKSVNVMNMPAKVSRIRGRRAVARRAPWKKAIVTLAPGESIEALEA